MGPSGRSGCRRSRAFPGGRGPRWPGSRSGRRRCCGGCTEAEELLPVQAAVAARVHPAGADLRRPGGGVEAQRIVRRDDHRRPALEVDRRHAAPFPGLRRIVTAVDSGDPGRGIHDAWRGGIDRQRLHETAAETDRGPAVLAGFGRRRRKTREEAREEKGREAAGERSSRMHAMLSCRPHCNPGQTGPSSRLG